MLILTASDALAHGLTIVAPGCGAGYAERPLRRAIGLCAVCPTPTEAGRFYCSYHREYDQWMYQKHRKRRSARAAARVLNRRQAGICRYCASPVVPRRKKCAAHLARDMEYYRRRRGV